MADINLGVGGANSAVAGGYEIANSLKFEPDNSERFIRDSGVGTNVSVTNATVSYWVKRTKLGTGTMYTWRGTSTWQNAAITNPAGYSDVLYVAGGNESYYKLVTNRVFRDTSAWYHIFIAYDTTQSTASDRIKIYINGVRETSFAVENYPAQNRDLEFLHVNGKWIFGWLETANSVAPCYLAEAYLFHDQTLAPTDFGEFDADTGIWKPIEFTGSFSQYDWYYDFENASSLGADASGNGNNVTTVYNLTSADQATDTPTNNFCIYNNLVLYSNPQVYAEMDIREGSTKATTTRAAWNRSVIGNMGVNNGKWYAEFTQTLSTGGSFVGVTSYESYDVNQHLGQSSDTKSIGYHSSNGNIYTNGSNASYGATYTTNDIISVALDMDNGYVYFAKNGTWQNSGDPTSGSSGTGGVALLSSSDTHTMGMSAFYVPEVMYANWGGYTTISIASGNTDANGYGNFEYAPPSGYYAMCTKNLAEFG